MKYSHYRSKVEKGYQRAWNFGDFQIQTYRPIRFVFRVNKFQKSITFVLGVIGIGFHWGTGYSKL